MTEILRSSQYYQILITIFEKNIAVMDLQARKLEFIEEYIRLADEKIILKLEKLLHSEKEKYAKSTLKSLSQTEIDKMLEESEQDISQGNILSHITVKEEVLNWRTSGK